jgi:HEAT repeat protein
MDPDLQVRHKVVESLAGFECERVVTFLLQAALDSNDEIARRAAFSLVDRKVFTPELEDIYIRILKDGIPKPEISIEDVDSFCKIVGILEPSCSLKLLNILVDAANSSSRRLRRTAITTIDCYPADQRLSALRQLVSTDDPTVLKSVALELGSAGDSDGVIPLVRATLECSMNVRKMALELLQRLTDIKDLPFLIKLLQSRWPSVKQFAAEQIIDMDSPEFIEPLLEAMKEKNADLQLVIIEAIASFAYDKRVIECLLATIRHGVITLRQRAVEILGDARVEEAIEPLIRVLGNRFLRKKAEKALLRIGDRKGMLEIKRRRLKKEYIAEMISQENPQM